MFPGEGLASTLHTDAQTPSAFSRPACRIGGCDIESRGSPPYVRELRPLRRLPSPPLVHESDPVPHRLWGIYSALRQFGPAGIRSHRHAPDSRSPPLVQFRGDSAAL